MSIREIRRNCMRCLLRIKRDRSLFNQETQALTVLSRMNCTSNTICMY